MTLWLIRHGKTEGNCRKRYIGARTDEGLCPPGIEELTVRRKEGRVPACELLFSSPMRRCLETGKVLYPRLRPIILSGLAETDFGIYDGLTFEEIKKLNPGFDLMSERPFPDGESRMEVKRRALDAFSEILRQARREKAKTAVVITHGGILMSVMASLVPDSNFYDWQADNCGGWGLMYRGWESGRIPAKIFRC